MRRASVGRAWREAVRSRWAPTAVFLIALAARLLVLVGAESYRFDPADNYWEAGYETGQIAWHLAEGRGFSLELSLLGHETVEPTAWISPAYPLIVAGSFSLFGSFSTTALILVLLFQALVGAGAAAALCLLGRRAACPQVGLFAGLGLALWPTAVARDVAVIWGTTLFIFLTVLLALLALEMRRTGRVPIAALAGLVAGVLLLTEPAGGLFVIALLVWVWLGSGRAALPELAVFGAMVILLLAPWTIRNAMVFERFIPLKSNLGNELFIGNHPGSDGTYVRVRDRVHLLSREERETLREGDEIDRSAILGERALDHIRTNPGHFLQATSRRAYLFWRVPSYGEWNRMGIGGWVGRFTGWLYEAGHLLILVAAGAGVLLALRDGRRELVPALLFLVTYPLAYYATHVGIGRYRSPVFPFLLLFAAYFVVSSAARLRALRSNRARAPRREAATWQNTS